MRAASSVTTTASSSSDQVVTGTPGTASNASPRQSVSARASTLPPARASSNAPPSASRLPVSCTLRRSTDQFMPVDATADG
ncbi:hypothetical protein [Roseateles chitinivorans]|uniref:hypothetical protein n=1 Tax=Roseateles chitinivorans TaxID=2917965 RepID=UPI003D6731FD